MAEVEFLTGAYLAIAAAPFVLVAGLAAFFAVYGVAVIIYDAILTAEFKADDEADAKARA